MASFVGSLKARNSDVRVDLSRGYADVAQELLNVAQIGAAVENVRGEAVAQQMRVNASDADALGRLAYNFSDVCVAQ